MMLKITVQISYVKDTSRFTAQFDFETLRNKSNQISSTYTILSLLFFAKLPPPKICKVIDLISKMEYNGNIIIKT
jgi:hypothetical protein